ncbi:MAG: hypothetical protein ACI9LY_003399 [Arenicella sp.]|jgi:uncharacterized protein (DUF2132 family)
MVDRSKSQQYKNHPLNGLGLRPMLNLLVDHYGWEILDQQININCFRSKPSIASSYKFLHRTQWAREKVEAFYLYKFMQYPRPTDEQHKFSPREREVDIQRVSETPAIIELDEAEFFDDPISGPVFPSKQSVTETRARAKKSSPSALSSKKIEDDSQASSEDMPEPSESTPSRRAKTKPAERESPDTGDSSDSSDSPNTSGSSDPWAKWKT